MRVLVIGGAGLFGRGVVAGLAGRAEVQVGGRSGPVRIDLKDPNTFGEMSRFDYVVNCSDTLRAPPDEAIARALDGGQCFVETGADPSTLERLLDRFHKRQVHSGLAVLGVGVFPGLSNLLLAQLARDLPHEAPMELALRFSPLSRGGAGMGGLVASALRTPPTWIEGGALRRAERAGAGPRLSFTVGPRDTVMAPMPEPILLHRSIAPQELRMLLAPEPPWMAAVLRWTAALLPQPLARARLFEGLVSAWMGFVRGRLLRDRGSEVELLARCPSLGMERRFYTDEGVTAGGLATAATVLRLEARSLWRSGRRTGLYLQEELLSFDEVFVQTCALAGPGLRLEAHPAPVQTDEDPPTPTVPRGAP